MSEQDQAPANSKIVPKLALVFGALLILTASIVAISHTDAFKLATSRQPERFTELYFSDPSHLPTQAASGHKLPVSFVVRNLETRDVTYTYRIDFTDASGTASFGQHQVLVPNGQTQVITQDILIPHGEGRGAVRINLINKGQSIHFWLERSSI